MGGKHEFSAGLLVGGKDVAEEQSRISSLNILVATPGRLLQHMDETAGFECSGVKILVLDEADRILDLVRLTPAMPSMGGAGGLHGIPHAFRSCRFWAAAACSRRLFLTGWWGGLPAMGAGRRRRGNPGSGAGGSLST